MSEITFKNRFFDEIGYKNSMTKEIFDRTEVARSEKWAEERSIQGGWDERVGWSLDTFMIESLYTWLNIYYEDASDFVDLEFHKFNLSYNGVEETKTENDCVLEVIECFKTFLLNANTLEPEKEKIAHEAAKRGFYILGEILPSLWW